MITEETVLPPWVTSARQRLANPTKELDHGLRHGQKKAEDGCETVGGTVSRKGENWFFQESLEIFERYLQKYKCPKWRCPKYHRAIFLKRWHAKHTNFGYNCYQCKWRVHFPIRCKKCKARSKRYSSASKGYKKLDLLRQIEERPNLKFVTFTREEWNLKIPFNMGWVAWDCAEQIKKKATRQFRNWRTRNKYWISREAKGLCYYECTMKTEWPYDEIQLHFHVHAVVCSKRIENKDIQTDLETLKPIPMSTTIQRNWGGIVDVRKCKTWKHKDGEVKTSRRFVMNYLLDYINKAAHWQSSRFGDWSS